MPRGGKNIKTFGQQVVKCYSELNPDIISSRGLHDLRQRYWKPHCRVAGCDCLLYKSRHTVQASILRALKECRRVGRRKVPAIPPALECPFHTMKASGPAKRAYLVLRGVVRQLERVMGRTIIVWEAQVVPGARWFDFWLPGWRVLVEVDGSQHASGIMHGRDIRQEKRDRAKEALAVAHGRTIVRLDVADEHRWRQLLRAALTHAASASPRVPRIYYSPANVPEKLPHVGHVLTSSPVKGAYHLDKLHFTTPLPVEVAR